MFQHVMVFIILLIGLSVAVLPGKIALIFCPAVLIFYF